MTAVDYGLDVPPGWDHAAGLADAGYYEGQPASADDLCGKCGAPESLHDQSDMYASGCPVASCSTSATQSEPLACRGGSGGRQVGVEHRATIFSVAVDAIDNYGWRQYSLYGADNAVCCIGALVRAADELGLGDEEYVAAMRVLTDAGGLKEAYPYACYPLAAWNDEPGRTVDEVKEVLWEAHGKTLAERGLL